MNPLDLPQCLSAAGTVELPGSKSISNRVLLLAALAEGVTVLHGLLASDDTARMMEALKMLGIDIEPVAAKSWRLTGCGGVFPVKQARLFLGNAGTAFRPLTAALALSGGDYFLEGTPRMHERPIGDLVDALRTLGADITYAGKTGYPPLHLRPASLRPGAVTVRGDVSSQFLSGLLMALPLAGLDKPGANASENCSTVEVIGELISQPYVDITLACMARFGVSVQRENGRFIVPGLRTAELETRRQAGFNAVRPELVEGRVGQGRSSPYISPGSFHVEGDASSASYFLALGAIGGGPVRVDGVGSDSVQGDIRFADALAQMGALITLGPHWIEARAPADGRLKAIDLDCNAIPDAAMTLATTALFAQGTTRLSNIASWRVKETDRIAAMAAELRKLGAQVEEGHDFLSITPPAALRAHSGGIDTYDDHRIAMCFSLAALGTPVRINDPGCVAKTFPDYFARFSAVTRAVPVIAIDGPSASGKGTLAARVAAALGFHYLDSGALYRLTALAAQRRGIAWNDETALAAIAAGLPVEFGENTVRLEGEEVSATIRSEALSSGASQVAAHPAVRSALRFRLRAFGRPPGLVADGRDMASIVFPEAALKIFLTASPEIRAERRCKQLAAAGANPDPSSVLADLEARDERDRQRPEAPLRPAAAAHLLDTGGLSIEETVDRVLALFSACRPSPQPLTAARVF